MRRLGHHDGHAILEEAQLVQLLCELERGLRQGMKQRERRPRVSVNPQVLVVLNPSLGITVVGDGVAGEVKRTTGAVGDDFDVVRIPRRHRVHGDLEGGDLNVSA